MLLSKFLGDGMVAEAGRKGDCDGMISTWQGEWSRVISHLKVEIGDQAFRNWLKPINQAINASSDEASRSRVCAPAMNVTALLSSAVEWRNAALIRP